MANENGGLTSPQGVLMLGLAIVLDIVSLIPIANDASDIVGIIIFGLWILIIRGGSVSNVLQKASKTLKRFGLAALIEFIPIVSIIPSWTWLVYKELKENSSTESPEEESEPQKPEEKLSTGVSID